MHNQEAFVGFTPQQTSQARFLKRSLYSNMVVLCNLPHIIPAQLSSFECSVASSKNTLPSGRSYPCKIMRGFKLLVPRNSPATGNISTIMLEGELKWEGYVWFPPLPLNILSLYKGTLKLFLCCTFTGTIALSVADYWCSCCHCLFPHGC